MLLTEQIPNISAKVNLLAKVVWPTLATLVPAAIVGAVKWVQDRTSKRRSAELTERISTLAKRISELPVLSLSSATPAATPQSALTAELESALRELTSLQKTRAIRRFTGLTTTTAKLRRGPAPVPPGRHRCLDAAPGFLRVFVLSRVCLGGGFFGSVNAIYRQRRRSVCIHLHLWCIRNSAAGHSLFRGQDSSHAVCPSAGSRPLAVGSSRGSASSGSRAEYLNSTWHAQTFSRMRRPRLMVLAEVWADR